MLLAKTFPAQQSVGVTDTVTLGLKRVTSLLSGNKRRTLWKQNSSAVAPVLSSSQMVSMGCSFLGAFSYNFRL